MRSILIVTALALLCTLCKAALADPKLSYVLKSGKLALSTVDGSSRLNKEFATTSDYSSYTAPFDLSSPTQLENDDVIRLTFSLSVEEVGKKAAAKDGPALGKEHVPHQAFAVLADAGATDDVSADAQHIWPLTVKPATGKVSWTLRMDRIPPVLLRCSSPLTLSLLIANFPANSAEHGAYAPLHLPLMTLTPPASLQALARENIAKTARDRAETEQGFYGLPEHRHTFSVPPTETMPSKKVSGLASIVTAAVPWAFLIVAVSLTSRCPYSDSETDTDYAATDL